MSKQLIFFYEPQTLYYEDIFKAFPEGGIVFYRVIEEGMWEISAMTTNKRISAYHGMKKLYEKYPALKECETMRFSGCKRQKLDTEGQCFDLRAFMKDDSDLLDSEMRMYKMYYGSEPKDMHIYYQQGNNFVIFHGTSIDEIDIEKTFSHPEAIIDLTYATFLEKMHQEEVDSGFEDEFEDESGVVAQIKEWIQCCTYKEFSEAIKSRVVGQQSVEMILASVYTYLRGIAGGAKVKNNIILAAPSGCGKTETYRALQNYFKAAIPVLPVLQVDVSNITAAGYKGSEPKDIVKRLFKSNKTNGIALVFLDEFDKKLIPSYGSNGVDNNAEVQHQLLTLIEGCVVENGNESIDTSNTFFVAMGSFNEQRKSRGSVVKHMGFGAANEVGESHYADITREDILEAGAGYELLGRFSMVVNYHPLNEDSTNRVIEMTREAISKELGVEIKLGQGMLQELGKHANSEFGCRMFRSCIMESAMSVVPALLLREDSDKCYILAEAPGQASLQETEEIPFPDENEENACS